MLGEFTGETIRYTGGVLDTKVVLPTLVREVATPIPDRFGEGVRRISGPVPVGGTILP